MTNTNGLILLPIYHKKDLDIIRKVYIEFGGSIVVATDDIGLQKASISYEGVIKTVFLEDMSSAYTVMEDVMNVKNKLNQWLIKYRANNPSHILEWINWAEGGNTTQKIQDLLLIINSYKKLLSNNIKCLVINRKWKYEWKNNIFSELAKERGIKIKEFHGWIYKITKSLNLLEVKINFYQKELYIYIPAILLNVLYVIKIVIRIILSKNSNTDNKNIQTDDEVGFLLSSNAVKHVDNVLIVMDEFKNEDGVNPIAYCWKARTARQKILKKDMRAINLESWIPISKYYAIITEYLRLKRSIISSSNNYMVDCQLEYGGISIQHLLWPYVIHFVCTELLNRMLLRYAALNYFTHHAPVAVRTWGSNILSTGRIFCGALDERFRASNKRSLVFDYPVGIEIDSAYLKDLSGVDLLFIASKKDNKIYRKYLGNKINLVHTGFSRHTVLKRFIEKNNTESSRRALSMSKECGKVLFYASSTILRGYMSPKEYSLVAINLIEFAVQSKNISLIIKPHPTEPEGFWSKLLNEINDADIRSNIYLIPRQNSAYHCINASDMVITKYSTLALEAMQIKRPVISIALDGESKFQDVYEDATFKFKSLSQMDKFIHSIVNDDLNFQRWKNERIEVQDRFLEENYSCSELPPENIIVNNVLSKLRILNES